MDKTLEMYEIGTMPMEDNPTGESVDCIHTRWCEDFSHQQYLVIYRVLKEKGLEWAISTLAGFLDPEGGDEDRVVKESDGTQSILRGNLGIYGYFKTLPETLRNSIIEDNR